MDGRWTGVNRELLAKLLGDVRENAYRARELVSKPFEELSLYEKLALRYLVVIELVEASATICVHLLRKTHGIEVEGYPHCFSKMGDVGLIPRTLAERLATAAKLHNLLVHRYWSIDDEKLYELVKTGLRDFEEYANLVEEVIEG